MAAERLHHRVANWRCRPIAAGRQPRLLARVQPLAQGHASAGIRVPPGGRQLADRLAVDLNRIATPRVRLRRFVDKGQQPLRQRPVARGERRGLAGPKVVGASRRLGLACRRVTSNGDLACAKVHFARYRQAHLWSSSGRQRSRRPSATASAGHRAMHRQRVRLPAGATSWPAVEIVRPQVHVECRRADPQACRCGIGDAALNAGQDPVERERAGR